MCNLGPAVGDELVRLPGALAGGADRRQVRGDSALDCGPAHLVALHRGEARRPPDPPLTRSPVRAAPPRRRRGAAVRSMCRWRYSTAALLISI